MRQSLYIHQQGKRAYQEDSLYVDPRGSLYIVCDGVGGSDAGSVASQAVVEALTNAYHNHGDVPVNLDTLRQWLMNLSDLVLPEAMRSDGISASTTIALVYISDAVALTAHIGDSRIYHIRSAAEWTASADHSVVRELYEAGVITSEEEMVNHPMKNRITRAINISDQQQVINPEMAAKDVMPGDLFLLCTDGIYERLTSQALVDGITNQRLTLESRWDLLRQFCQVNSQDNYTAILIMV